MCKSRFNPKRDKAIGLESLAGTGEISRLRFRLKDQSLQRKLDEISAGNFSVRLQEAALSKYALCFGNPQRTESSSWLSVAVDFGPFAIDAAGKGFLKFSAQFAADEIEVF